MHFLTLPASRNAHLDIALVITLWSHSNIIIGDARITLADGQQVCGVQSVAAALVIGGHQQYQSAIKFWTEIIANQSMQPLYGVMKQVMRRRGIALASLLLLLLSLCRESAASESSHKVEFPSVPALCKASIAV